MVNGCPEWPYTGDWRHGYGIRLAVDMHTTTRLPLLSSFTAQSSRSLVVDSSEWHGWMGFNPSAPDATANMQARHRQRVALLYCDMHVDMVPWVDAYRAGSANP